MHPFSILYVEDQTDLRETMEFLLQAPGRQITACACAETAWQAAELQPYDVLITDLTLPRASGLDLATRLLARNPQQWVVLCTGASQPSDLATLGANVAALRKPFELDDLDALLERISRQTRQPPQDEQAG